MGLGSWLRRTVLGAAPQRTRRSGRVRASYDAAQTTTENESHWGYADALNANAANSPEVRKVLRDRAQYESDNNGYVCGLVDKLGNDLIGRGPRPQVRIPGASRDVCRAIEAYYLQWARLTGLAAKLRMLDNAAVVRGEGFGVLVTNPTLPMSGVQLDLRLYETDQVETPFLDWSDPLSFPGGRIDEHGNVVEWHFLKVHPGSQVWAANYTDYDPLPADRVIHWYKPRRAGQLRGVPEIMSSLTLYGYLRRYTLATLVAAETAANFAGVLETSDVTAPTGDAPTVETMDEVAIARGSLLTLPAGWKANAFKPEQPGTSYGQFKTELLTEAGQPLGAPQNVATGSSAAYNYSSARLDHGVYHRGIGVRREDYRSRVLDPIFRAWLGEARLIPGLIPEGLPPIASWSWEWYFDGFSSLDPQKDAAARKLELEVGTTTLAEVFAEKGQDWEEALEQRARERQRMTDLGIAPAARPVKATADDLTALDAEGGGGVSA